MTGGVCRTRLTTEEEFSTNPNLRTSETLREAEPYRYLWAGSVLLCGTCRPSTRLRAPGHALGSVVALHRTTQLSLFGGSLTRLPDVKTRGIDGNGVSGAAGGWPALSSKLSVTNRSLRNAFSPPLRVYPSVRVCLKTRCESPFRNSQTTRGWSQRSDPRLLLPVTPASARSPLAAPTPLPHFHGPVGTVQRPAALSGRRSRVALKRVFRGVKNAQA